MTTATITTHTRMVRCVFCIVSLATIGTKVRSVQKRWHTSKPIVVILMFYQVLYRTDPHCLEKYRHRRHNRTRSFYNLGVQETLEIFLAQHNHRDTLVHLRLGEAAWLIVPGWVFHLLDFYIASEGLHPRITSS